MTPPDLPKEGQRIRYTAQTARTGHLCREDRVGTVTCVWGYDGHAIVDTDSGSCHPGFGDTWEVVDDRA